MHQIKVLNFTVWGVSILETLDIQEIYLYLAYGDYLNFKLLNNPNGEYSLASQTLNKLYHRGSSLFLVFDQFIKYICHSYDIMSDSLTISQPMQLFFFMLEDVSIS
ncbi:unnamed protein product [Meganyctiphanes norvegica]|uniref:Maturase K n=1 Tax=Meganyctiphanes norvegica TaxID=48144 RepID=A0AAV2QBA2_MEGNR